MFEEIMQTPAGQFGKIGKFVIFQVRLWIHSHRLLKKNHAGLQASALSCYTAFGLVPMAVLMLFIFQLFPSYKNADQHIKTAVYEQLQLSAIELPSQAGAGSAMKLTEHIDGIMARFFIGFNRTTAAVLCLAMVILAAIMVMSTIEKAFNNIWGIGRGRSVLHRAVNYWGLLTLVPLLAFAAISVAMSYSGISDSEKSFLSATMPPLVSFLATSLCLCVMYLILPNTRVSVRAAVWGATFSAFLWLVSKGLFKLYITGFMPNSPVYGLLGLVPLGVFWFYISWCIVLFGFQLTFTTQHLHKLDAAEIAAATRRQSGFFIASELTIMNVVGEIASAFEGGSGMVEPAVIAGKLNIPLEFVDRILSHLVTAGLLVRVSEPKDGFMPARDPGSMKLADIAEAVSKAGFAQMPEQQSAGLKQIVRMQRETLSKFTVRQLLTPAHQQAEQPQDAAAEEQRITSETTLFNTSEPDAQLSDVPQTQVEAQTEQTASSRGGTASEPQGEPPSQNTEKKDKIRMFKKMMKPNQAS